MYSIGAAMRPFLMVGYRPQGGLWQNQGEIERFRNLVPRRALMRARFERLIRASTAWLSRATSKGQRGLGYHPAVAVDGRQGLCGRGLPAAEDK